MFSEQLNHEVGLNPLFCIQLCFGQVARKHYRDSELVMAFVNRKRVEVGNKRDLEDILSSEDSEPVFITWISNHYSVYSYS